MFHLHRAAFATLLVALATGATAQELPPLDMPSAKPAHKGHAARGKQEATTPSSLEQIHHDLLHGSAAQQEMERNDNAAALTRPVDHNTLEFGHEIHGQ